MKISPKVVERLSIMKYVKEHAIQYYAFILLRFVFVSLSIIIPYLISKCVDNIISNQNILCVKTPFYSILLLVWSEFVLNCVINDMNVKLSNRIAFSIEFDTLHSIKFVPYKVVKKYDDAYLTQRINNDSVCIGDYVVEKVPYFISDLFLICLTIVMGVMIDRKIGLAIAILLVIYFSIYFFVKKMTYRRGKEMVEAQSNFFSMLSNQIFNLLSIKINAWYKETDSEFLCGVTPFFESSVKFLRTEFLTSALTTLLNRLAYGSAIIILGVGLLQGEVTAGELATIAIYIEVLLQKIQSVMRFGQERERFRIAKDRLSEILCLPKERNGIIKLDNIDTISINNLSVSYTNKKVIDRVNLRLERGKIYLLLGENGSGKTTFINALLGVIEPMEGEIKYNGYSVEDIDMYWLRKHKIGVTCQEPILRNGSIYDNLFYGIEREEDRRTEKNYIEKLLEFVKELEAGMNTNITSKNILLSGGEKQRIAICRTMLKNGDVMIFDEPTSALDVEGVSIFIDLIKQLREKHIVLIISHDEKVRSVADEVVRFDA